MPLFRLHSNYQPAGDQPQAIAGLLAGFAAGEREEILAQKFIDGVVALNRDIGIPTTLATLREKDIPSLAAAALHEAHTGYPVPRYMSQDECETMIRGVLPAEPAAAPAAKKAATPAAAKPAARKSAAAKKTAVKTPAAKAPARKGRAAPKN